MQTQTDEQLVTKKCVPCEGGVPKYSWNEAEEQLKSLDGWKLTHDGQRIRKDWVVKNFMAGIDFFNAVARLAEDGTASSRSASRRLSQRVDRNLDPRDRRPVGERFYFGGEDRSAAGEEEGLNGRGDSVGVHASACARQRHAKA